MEAKIEKHNHYQKQLEISHQKLKHVESFGDQEHISRNKERYALLEEDQGAGLQGEEALTGPVQPRLQRATQRALRPREPRAGAGGTSGLGFLKTARPPWGGLSVSRTSVEA